MKYYYNNLLANENITAKPNVAWVADITEIELNQQKKFYIFLCVDVHTNVIIAHCTSQQEMKSNVIIKHLSKAIDKRFKAKPERKVILHTDRGTQFTGRAYKSFLEHFEKFIIPSMSRSRTPTDNPVAERFMRTFKEHKINGKIIEQSIQEAFLLEAKSYRKIISTYVHSLNKKPNKKSLLKSPHRYDNESITASFLMCEPLYPKAFTERFGDDIRRDEIMNFKSQNNQVISILEQIAAKRAEVVDSTPFDFDDNLALQLIDKRLMELYQLIQDNPLVIKKYVQDAVEPVGEDIKEEIDELRAEIQSDMEVLNYKLDMLLPKEKKDRITQPLRDPVSGEILPIFLTNAGESYQRRKDLKRAQLRITYTILYHCGLRINEIRHLNQNDIQRAIEASQFSLIHHKTKQAYVHVLSEKAVQQLKELNLEMSIIFDKYQYKYLFGKDKPMHPVNLIAMVNKDLKHTCQKYSIPYNIKSHSFRVNMITNLLKVTSVQNTADIIGHTDIRSTMSYNRYTLTKSQIQELLNKIDHNNRP